MKQFLKDIKTNEVKKVRIVGVFSVILLIVNLFQESSNIKIGIFSFSVTLIVLALLKELFQHKKTLIQWIKEYVKAKRVKSYSPPKSKLQSEAKKPKQPKTKLPTDKINFLQLKHPKREKSSSVPTVPIEEPKRLKVPPKSETVPLPIRENNKESEMEISPKKISPAPKLSGSSSPSKPKSPPSLKPISNKQPPKLLK